MPVVIIIIVIAQRVSVINSYAGVTWKSAGNTLYQRMICHIIMDPSPSQTSDFLIQMFHHLAPDYINTQHHKPESHCHILVHYQHRSYACSIA